MANGEMIGNSLPGEFDVVFDPERAVKAAQEMIRHAQGARSWDDTGDVSAAAVHEMPHSDDCSDDDDSCPVGCSDGDDSCAEPSDPVDLCYVSQANDIGCSDGTACADLCP